MKNPKKKLFCYTWVGWLNIILLQWFFIRLAYGSKWKIIGPIVPMTGWKNNFIYIYKSNIVIG